MEANKLSYYFIKYITLFLFCTASIACEQAKQIEPVEPKKQHSLVEAYSLYREAFKQENYPKALKYWKLVMEINPCFRKTPFTDGAKMYKYLIENATNKSNQQNYTDALAKLYKMRINCFGE